MIFMFHLSIKCFARKKEAEQGEQEKEWNKKQICILSIYPILKAIPLLLHELLKFIIYLFHLELIRRFTTAEF